MPVVIRPAEPTDAPALAEVFIAARAVALPYLPNLHSDEETRGFIAGIVMVNCLVWVAEDVCGEVVGFAALEGGWLDHLYLRPDVRRQGIGTLLLDQVRRAAPEGLRLYVFARNTAARAFYEKHGFVVVAEGDGSGNEENEPDLTMQWRPAPPGRPR